MAYRSVLLAVGCLVLVGVSDMRALADESGRLPVYPFRDAYPLCETPYNVGGTALLEVPNRKLSIGEALVLDIRFTNAGGAKYVYNPFFAGFFPRPVIVAVYDANREYVGRYPGESRSRRGGASAETWVYIWGEAYVGNSFRGLAGHVPDTKSSSSNNPLPPGKYYLQAIFLNGFIGKNVKLNRMLRPADGDLNEKEFDTGELFRSNVVEIELLPVGAKPATRPAPAKPARPTTDAAGAGGAGAAEPGAREADEAPGASKEGLELRVRVAKEQTTAVEPATILISVKNVADRPLSFVETNPERDFRLTVTDSEGHNVPLTRYGQVHTGQAVVWSRRFFVELNPGEEAHYALWLTRLFDLSDNGTYSVQVRLAIPRREAKGVDRLTLDAELVADPVRLEVTEPAHPSTRPAGG